MPEMLELARCRQKVDIRTLMMVDSLHLTEWSLQSRKRLGLGLRTVSGRRCVRGNEREVLRVEAGSKEQGHRRI